MLGRRVSLGEFRQFSEPLQPLQSFFTLQLGSRSASGPEGQKKKKKNNLGRENKKCVWKRAWGGRKNAPFPDKRPGTQCVRGSLWPSGSQKSRQKPRKGGDQPSALEGLPLALTRARGGRDHPYRPPRDHGPGLLVKSVQPQNKTKRGKGKNKDKRSTAKPLPPRVPRKGASEGASELNPHKFQENPKNPRGPEWRPEKTPRSRTHGQKGRNNKRGGTQKQKRNKQKGACGGVLLLPDLYLLKKKPRKTTSTKKPKEERTNPKKHQTWHQENFFQTLSGANRHKLKQKHRQKTTKKHKTNTTTQKQKFAPENFFKKRP